MVCHEVWDYDDIAHVATLTSFTILCPNCNLVHHIGRASQIRRFDEALAHMTEVNRMTIEEAIAVANEAFEEWKRRSGQSWTVAVDAALRSSCEELAEMEGASASPGEGRQRAQARDR
jgi:hypothetical protein